MTEIIDQANTTDLWLEYRRSQSAVALSLIETELVSRGELQFGTAYVGQRTASAYQRSLYTRTGTTSSADLRNCSDFASSAAAQRFFIQAGGPLNDPHILDADGDGLACEWGVRIARIASYARQQARSTFAAPRRTTSSRCYVGPRGGTYTITASGNRNYSGC
ncbi:excalibur calcium-binding domain-containing protein [Yoonia sp. I 8.24]|uniref:excalibur calcium-binding domain-containing protein n=1 Tax=Yoonia sp. I 8.24 TaxID=1537229 RepID=UPI001EDE8D33|nr:excalibur calcium-binding domain-containing protein [Yoonia sp. I 8.24]